MKRRTIWNMGIHFAAVSLIAAGAIADGGTATGNGGDAIVAEFLMTGRVLSRELKTSSSKVLPADLPSRFNSAVESAKVQSVDHAILNGVEVDAINYPDETPPRIQVSIARWPSTSSVVHRRRQIVLHEFLGILRLNDANYELSEMVLVELEKSPFYQFGGISLGMQIDEDGRLRVLGQGEFTRVDPEDGSTKSVRSAMSTVRYQADGRIDRSFGDKGRILAPGLSLRKVKYLSDGSSIGLVGQFKNPRSKKLFPIVMKLDPSGALVSGFGQNGVTPVEAMVIGNNLTVQDDGKILVSGGLPMWDASEGSSYAVARLNPDGALDKSFGKDGIATGDFGLARAKAFATAADVVELPNGKIVVAGEVNADHSDPERPFRLEYEDAAVAMLNPNGSLDESFGDHGSVVTTVSPLSYDRVRKVEIQRGMDGTSYILLVGDSRAQDYRESHYLMRYQLNGHLDEGFGSQGIAVADYSGLKKVRPRDGVDVVIQSGGRLVLIGHVDKPFGSWVETRIGLAGFTPNGKLDSTFGSNGIVLAQYKPREAAADYVRSVLLGKNDEIYIAGDLNYGNYGLMRILRDGKLDPAFGNDGVVITDLVRDFSF